LGNQPLTEYQKIQEDGEIMGDFNIVEDLIVEKENYKINNPKIIAKINNDLVNGNPFHYLFTGATGVGKTFLGTTVVLRCKEPWELVSTMKHYGEHLRLIASDYIDKMEADRKNDNKFSTTCLMIDDLGDEKPSTIASHDYFGGLLEKRYLYIKRKPESRTIITTNLHSQELIEVYGSRVYDRLCEHYIICKFKNHSFRKAELEVIEG
jgi:DNA replication protein DnaC